MKNKMALCLFSFKYMLILLLFRNFFFFIGKKYILHRFLDGFLCRLSGLMDFILEPKDSETAKHPVVDKILKTTAMTWRLEVDFVLKYIIS